MQFRFPLDRGAGWLQPVPTSTSSDMESPPATPISPNNPQGQGGSIDRRRENGHGSSHVSPCAAEKAPENHCWPILSTRPPRPLTGTLHLERDGSSRPPQYGSGGWSVVYKAMYYENQPSGTGDQTLGLPSPPPSPRNVTSGTAGARVVAVKAPLPHHLENPEAVIFREAQILNYIQPSPPGSNTSGPETAHVVAFLGYEPCLRAAVMEAVPLTLAEFSRTRGETARASLTTDNMAVPVVGDEQWFTFASGLIAGLAYLRRLKVVHGDIKPANVLLRPRSGEQADVFDAVYCDFSSSHVLEDGLTPPPISAVTPDYAAPELLNAFHKRPGSGPPVANFASDVFALGATLLVPAVGHDIYAGTSSRMQKLTLALRGNPLGQVRCMDQASRVRPGGLVDRVVRDALVGIPEDRLDPCIWHSWMVEEGERRKEKQRRMGRQASSSRPELLDVMLAFKDLE